MPSGGGELDQVLRRHRAFWDMEEVDEPLLSVGVYQPLQSRAPFRLADGALVRDGDQLSLPRVSAEGLAAQSGLPSVLVEEEFLHEVGPYDLCWTEAIAGCPLYWRSGFVWAEPFLRRPAQSRRLALGPDNPWLERLLALGHLLTERSQGRYPVTQPLLRGPIDIAAAALGDEPLCWALTDDPEGLRAVLAVCTDTFIGVARAWQAAVPRFAEGRTLFGIWAPGSAVRTQCDNAALLSPRTYREYLLPCDERLCAAFEYPLMHTHSCFIAMVAEVLLEVKGLRGIQVSLDYPGGPPIAQLLPTFQRLNRHLPLIITGGIAEDELELLLDQLSPRGLCLQVQIHE
jgi:hypothetical protein